MCFVRKDDGNAWFESTIVHVQNIHVGRAGLIHIGPWTFHGFLLDVWREMDMAPQ